MDDINSIHAGGELLEVEFKGEERAPLSDVDLVKAVVCLANAQGGSILIGVEDDSRVTGARPRHGNHTDPDKVRSVVRNRTEPNLEVQVSLAQLDGKEVLVVKVPRSSIPVSTSDGTSLRRVIGSDGRPACIPFHAHEHIGRDLALGVSDLTSRTCDAAEWADLDPIQFQRMRAVIAARSGDRALLDLGDSDLAKAIGAVETKGVTLVPTFTGLLMLGFEASLRQHLPTHEAMFQVLTADASVRVNDAFRKPLVELSELIEERFRARVEEREVQVGMIRLPIPDFAFSAFREAVLNALFHRDYRENNSVYVQWHPDRLDILSPGGFPEGVTVQNVLTHEPKPRNRRLYEAAKRIGLVEQTGRGVDKVYLGQLRYGRPVPDYSTSDNTGVRLALRGGNESLSFAAYVFERERRRGAISVSEMIALNKLFHERRITTAALAEDMQSSPPEARSVLERLVEEGLVQPKGEGKGRVYHLSRTVYAALGRPEAHARVHGMEVLDQERAVLELIERHGAVARRAVMDRCGLTPNEASYLLSKMVASGRLIPKGDKRGRVYELPVGQ